MSFARPEPFESSFQDKIVGLFVVWAIVLLLVFTVVHEDLDTGTTNYTPYYTTLSKAYGIKVGAPVVISGVAIGSIKQISLTDQALVRVEILLNNQYDHFYTPQSTLLVESSIALDTVLSGVGLIFQSGGISDKTLPPNTYINAIEPQSLQEMLDEWKIGELAQDVKSIVKNINMTLGTLGENQQNLSGSLENASLLIESLLQSAEQIPQVLEGVEKVSTSTSLLMTNLDKNLVGSQQQLTELIASTNAILQQVDSLTANLASSSETAPELMQNLNLVSQRTAKLMLKLNRHWLLGSDDYEVMPGTNTLSIQDELLYQAVNKPKAETSGD